MHRIEFYFVCKFYLFSLSVVAGTLDFLDLTIYLTSKMNVIAFKFPSILCPSKNNPIAVQNNVIAYPTAGYLMPNSKLFKINVIPAMYIGLPTQCRILLIG
jgi:hypothetical protein